MARAQEAAGYRMQPATKRRRWYSLRMQVSQFRLSEAERLERLERIAQRQRTSTVDPRELIVRQRWF